MASRYLSHEYDSNDITFLSNSQELMGVAAMNRRSVELHVVSRLYESLRFIPFLYNIILLLFNALNLLYWGHRRDLKAGRSNGSDRVPPDVIWRRVHHECRDGHR